MIRSLRALGLTAALALVTGPVAACSADGDRDAFCDRVASVPDLEEILGSLDTSDPGGVARHIEDAIAQFRALEADAPGAIRSDLARLRQGVELVLDAVEDNPGDLPGARQDILARTDELAGLAGAATSVARYVDEECGISLDRETGTTTAPPSPTSPPSTTEG